MERENTYTQASPASQGLGGPPIKITFCRPLVISVRTTIRNCTPQWLLYYHYINCDKSFSLSIKYVPHYYINFSVLLLVLGTLPLDDTDHCTDILALRCVIMTLETKNGCLSSLRTVLFI